MSTRDSRFDQWDALTPEALRSRGGLKWAATDPGELGLWVAEMDFGTAPAVLDAWAHSAQGLDFGYPSEAHMADLADATAAWYRARYGWQVPAADIHPLPDVVAGLAVTITEFSRAGAPVIVPTPAYMPFLETPPRLGRQVVQVPMLRDAADRFVLDLDAIDAAFAAHGAGVLVLANPGNPNGRVYDAAELAEAAEIAARHGARIFSDEIHAPLTLGGRVHTPLAAVSATAAQVAVTATSASKAWNIPGLKCAQLILTADADREVWHRIGAAASHGASTPGMRANAAAYRHGGEWLDDVRAYLDRNHAVLRDGIAAVLPDARLAPLEGTYLAWLDLTAYDLGDDPGDALHRRCALAVNNGPAFGAAGAGCVRINIATPRPILEEAIARLGRLAVAAPRG